MAILCRSVSRRVARVNTPRCIGSSQLSVVEWRSAFLHRSAICIVQTPVPFSTRALEKHFTGGCAQALGGRTPHALLSSGLAVRETFPGTCRGLERFTSAADKGPARPLVFLGTASDIGHFSSEEGNLFLKRVRQCAGGAELRIVEGIVSRSGHRAHSATQWH